MEYGWEIPCTWKVFMGNLIHCHGGCATAMFHDTGLDMYKIMDAV